MPETIEGIVHSIRQDRCYSHPIFQDWATTRPNVDTIGALFHQIQNFCASTRPGGAFPDALASHGLVEQHKLIQEIVDSEEGHGRDLATMTGYIVNKEAGMELCPDLHDQEAIEAKLRYYSDKILATLPGWDPATGLAVQTRNAMAVFDRRQKTDRDSTIHNLGVAIALEMVSNGQIIPGEKHCLVDSGAYGVSMDDDEMYYLVEHYGEIGGAEQQHEENAIAAVDAILNEETERLIMEGVRDFLDSLVKLWDFLDSALLQSGLGSGAARW